VVITLLLAAALSGSAGPELVVRDEQGREIGRAALPDGSFALAYRHSYYRAPAREHFTVTNGVIRLDEIASPRAAVLDYYALAGERSRRGGWLQLRLAEPRRYERLPLIATATGRRTLVVGNERVRLYGREARHLTIEVDE